MKKVNFARIIWILGVFLVLIIILIAVMDYKIHYQYQSKNTLYFYECNGELCVIEVKDDSHLLYSKYECGYEGCPTFKSAFEDTYAILIGESSHILFNYRTGSVISSDYDNYQLLNNNYLIVTKNDYQGIIDLDNNIIVPISYEQLGYFKGDYLLGYGLNYIIAKKNDKYGIISTKDGSVIEEFIYDETDIDNLQKILNDKEKLL